MYLSFNTLLTGTIFSISDIVFLPKTLWFKNPNSKLFNFLSITLLVNIIKLS